MRTTNLGIAASFVVGVAVLVLTIAAYGLASTAASVVAEVMVIAVLTLSIPAVVAAVVRRRRRRDALHLTDLVRGYLLFLERDVARFRWISQIDADAFVPGPSQLQYVSCVSWTEDVLEKLREHSARLVHRFGVEDVSAQLQVVAPGSELFRRAVERTDAAVSAMEGTEPTARGGQLVIPRPPEDVFDRELLRRRLEDLRPVAAELDAFVTPYAREVGQQLDPGRIALRAVPRLWPRWLFLLGLAAGSLAAGVTAAALVRPDEFEPGFGDSILSNAGSSLAIFGLGLGLVLVADRSRRRAQRPLVQELVLGLFDLVGQIVALRNEPDESSFAARLDELASRVERLDGRFQHLQADAETGSLARATAGTLREIRRDGGYLTIASATTTTADGGALPVPTQQGWLLIKHATDLQSRVLSVYWK